MTASVGQLRPPNNYDEWWYIYGLRNHPNILRTTSTGRVLGPEEHIAWIKKHHDADSSLVTLLYVPSTGRIAGVVSFDLKGFPLVTWSFYVDPEYQGRGYGRRMLNLAMSYATRSLRCDRVRGVVRMDNLPSQRLHESLGFTRVSINDKLWEYIWTSDH